MHQPEKTDVRVSKEESVSSERGEEERSTPAVTIAAVPQPTPSAVSERRIYQFGRVAKCEMCDKPLRSCSTQSFACAGSKRLFFAPEPEME